MKKVGIIAVCCLALLLILPVQALVFAACATGTLENNGNEQPTSAYTGTSVNTPAQAGADLKTVNSKTSENLNIKSGDLSIKNSLPNIADMGKNIAVSIAGVAGKYLSLSTQTNSFAKDTLESSMGSTFVKMIE